MDPGHALVIKNWGSYVVEPIDSQHCRVIARSHVDRGAAALGVLPLHRAAARDHGAAHAARHQGAGRERRAPLTPSCPGFGVVLSAHRSATRSAVAGTRPRVPGRGSARPLRRCARLAACLRRLSTQSSSPDAPRASAPPRPTCSSRRATRSTPRHAARDLGGPRVGRRPDPRARRHVRGVDDSGGEADRGRVRPRRDAGQQRRLRRVRHHRGGRPRPGAGHVRDQRLRSRPAHPVGAAGDAPGTARAGGQRQLHGWADHLPGRRVLPRHEVRGGGHQRRAAQRGPALRHRRRGRRARPDPHEVRGHSACLGRGLVDKEIHRMPRCWRRTPRTPPEATPTRSSPPPGERGARDPQGHRGRAPAYPVHRHPGRQGDGGGPHHRRRPRVGRHRPAAVQARVLSVVTPIPAVRAR